MQIRIEASRFIHILYEHISNECIIVRIRMSLSPPPPSCKTAVVGHRVHRARGSQRRCFSFREMKKKRRKKRKNRGDSRFYLSRICPLYSHDPHYCRYSSDFSCVENISCGFRFVSLRLAPPFSSRYSLAEPSFKESRVVFTRVSLRRSVMDRNKRRNPFEIIPCNYTLPVQKSGFAYPIFIRSHAETVAGRIKVKDKIKGEDCSSFFPCEEEDSTKGILSTVGFLRFFMYDDEIAIREFCYETSGRE